MVKLWNGNTLDEALRAFRKYKKPNNWKEKDPYHKIEEYVALLDECFGIDGYVVHYSDTRMEVLPTGQCIIFMKAVVDVLGENRDVVFSMEGYGTYNISISREGGNYINLSTVGTNANVNALKGACINAGAFGKRNVSSKQSEGEPAGNRASVRNGAPRPSSQNAKGSSAELTKRFYVNKEMVEFWKDRDGKPAYRLIGQVAENGVMSEMASEVLFYPDQYGKACDKFNQLVAWCGSPEAAKGRLLSFTVSPVSEDKRNKNYAASYIFKSFAG